MFWVADDEQKKMVLGVYNGNFETYTRYSEVADEKRSLRIEEYHMWIQNLLCTKIFNFILQF